jgi:hypothetical protein
VLRTQLESGVIDSGAGVSAALAIVVVDMSEAIVVLERDIGGRSRY